jgi:hypothetical protein
MSETRARLNGDQATGIDTNLSADLGPTLTPEIVTIGGVFETLVSGNSAVDRPDPMQVEAARDSGAVSGTASKT